MKDKNGSEINKPKRKLHAAKRINSHHSERKNPSKSSLDNLKYQTPSSRRKSRQNKKVDAFGAGVSNSSVVHHNYTVKTTKKTKKLLAQKRRAAFAKAVFFLGFAALISFVLLCGLVYSLNKTDKEEHSSVYMYVYIDGGFVKGDYTKIPPEKIYFDDKMWIDMQMLSDAFGFTVTGDDNSLKFIPDTKTGEYIKFTDNSPICEINGTEVIIGDIPIRTETEFYVPIDFIKSYMNHITYTFDNEKNILYVVCDGYYDTAATLVEETPDFVLKSTVYPEKISEDGLSTDILNRTFFNSDVILYDSMGNVIYDPAKDPAKVTNYSAGEETANTAN